MSMQDPVADMLTRIRNAQTIGIESIRLPFSNLKIAILQVLKQEGYINDFNVLTDENKKDIHVELKYFQGKPVIELIKRVSKPSLRVYKGYQAFPQIRGGLGLVVVSTSKGVMSGRAAQAQRLGGEVLCIVE